MELAELMQSFQESMKAAKKDSEAREARAARILTAERPRPGIDHVSLGRWPKYDAFWICTIFYGVNDMKT